MPLSACIPRKASHHTPK